mgnify:CR=1 FL=1
MLALGGMLFGTGVAVADGAKADSALRETVGDLMIYGFDPILGNLGGSLGTDDELPSPQEKAQQVREILEYLESLIGPESNEMQGFKHGDGPDRFPIRPAGPDVPLY